VSLSNVASPQPFRFGSPRAVFCSDPDPENKGLETSLAYIRRTEAEPSNGTPYHLGAWNMGLAALFRPDYPEETRKGSRFKVFLPIVISQAGNEAHGQLIEVSNEGARGHSRTVPEPRQPIEIEWEGKTLSAKVVWVKGEKFGVEFDRRLSNNQLLAMIAG
jgi:hypothetical protein